MHQTIDDLLYSVPNHITYTDMPEELDLEDITPELIKSIKNLLNNDDTEVKIRAAILLTHWGEECGFDALVKLYKEQIIQNYYIHRLHGYDTSNEQMLEALLAYRAIKSDFGQEQQVRQQIFPMIKNIIQQAHQTYASIRRIFYLVTEKNYIEYILLIKKYLALIIDDDKQYWNIHDTMRLLLTIDDKFVNDLLIEKNMKLSDFGL